MIPFKVACQRFGFLCQKVIMVGVDFFFFFFLHKKGQTSSSEHVYILNEFKILKLWGDHLSFFSSIYSVDANKLQ